MTNTTATDPKRLDGQVVAKALLQRVSEQVRELAQKTEKTPGLTVILVGEDPASQVYVGKKVKMAQEVGIRSELKRFPADLTEAQLLAEIAALNADQSVDGILVQLPLPKSINSQAVLEAIAPDKDVDGFHPINVGKLASGLYVAAKPCTPAGVMTLLAHYNIAVEGLHAVILGRSNIVGKPMAQLLLAANATVTICHSKTRDLPALLKQADMIVAAIGIAKYVQPDWVKPGAVLIDVGINRTAEGKLVGDIDYSKCHDPASAITPVPGGVGPMTVATLMENTVRCFEAHWT